MRRIAAISALTVLAGISAWTAAPALQNTAQEAPAPAQPEPPATTTAPIAPKPTRKADDTPPLSTALTPMAERVAVLGLLNKRNGIARDITLRPGQSLRIGDIVVRLRACETSAPWEDEKLTGAFVQADVRGADTKWRRVFSGWLYAESPSLNVVEHPIYDVWPKSCTMRYPDVGPNTVPASSNAGAPSARSSARKSPAEPSTPAASAPASNAT